MGEGAEIFLTSKLRMNEQRYHIRENKTWMEGTLPHQLLTLLNLQTPLTMLTMLKQRWDTKDYYA